LAAAMSFSTSAVVRYSRVRILILAATRRTYRKMLRGDHSEMG
jgi:hypothetical protein